MKLLTHLLQAKINRRHYCHSKLYSSPRSAHLMVMEHNKASYFIHVNTQLGSCLARRVVTDATIVMQRYFDELWWIWHPYLLRFSLHSLNGKYSKCLSYRVHSQLSYEGRPRHFITWQHHIHVLELAFICMKLKLYNFTLCRFCPLASRQECLNSYCKWIETNTRVCRRLSSSRLFKDLKYSLFCFNF